MTHKAAPLPKLVFLEAGEHEPYTTDKIIADSRDVARAIGKEHYRVIRMINTMRTHLNHAKNGGVKSLKFFIPATYTDEKSEERGEVRDMRGHRDPRPHPTRLPGLVGTGGGNSIQLWADF